MGKKYKKEKIEKSITIYLIDIVYTEYWWYNKY